MHILKQLKTKKGRGETGLFVVEGEKFVTEIPEQWEVVRYVFSRGYASAHPAGVAQLAENAPHEVLSDSRFASYADTQTPQGIAAVVRARVWTMEEILSSETYAAAPHAQPIFLLAENLQDPGNAGTLIRTAAAAGAIAVILTEGCADAFSPKVLRAAAGAVLRLPVVCDAPLVPALNALRRHGITIYAAHPRGGIPHYEANMKKGFCLMVGNEAHGLTQLALSHADMRLHLPMADETESLNAAAAGSILLYEAVRQRN